MSFSTRGHWSLITALLAFFSGCDASMSKQQKRDGDRTEAQLDRILADFESSDAQVRAKASARLKKVGEKELTAEQTRRLMDAASRDWPVNEDSDPSGAVLQAVFSQAHPVDWPRIVADFPRYSESARLNVMYKLVEQGDVASAKTFQQLVEKHAAPGLVPAVPLEGYLESNEAAKTLLPSLLAHAGSDDLGYYIHRFALNAADKTIISDTELALYAEPLVAKCRPMIDRMRTQESAENDDWIWSDDYQSDRAHATLLLDLLGHLPPAEVNGLLTDSLSSHDPRVKYFAAKSLLAHGQEVPPAALEEIAASAEMRNWLFEHLEQIARLDLFPEQFKTQESLAESNMVSWLTYPMELARTPHEIELMESFDSEDGDERFFLFRFRTREPHWAAKDGWMAGLSGPFEIAAMPTTDAGGDTFSTFTKWDEKTPAEHFAEITGLLKESRKRWSENADAAEGE